MKNNLYKKLKLSSGTSLVEVIVASSVLLGIALGVSSTLQHFSKANKVIKNVGSREVLLSSLLREVASPSSLRSSISYFDSQPSAPYAPLQVPLVRCFRESGTNDCVRVFNGLAMFFRESGIQNTTLSDGNTLTNVPRGGPVLTGTLAERDKKRTQWMKKWGVWGYLPINYTNFILTNSAGIPIAGPGVSYTQNFERCQGDVNAKCPIHANAYFTAICENPAATSCDKAVGFRFVVEVGQADAALGANSNKFFLNWAYNDISTASFLSSKDIREVDENFCGPNDKMIGLNASGQKICEPISKVDPNQVVQQCPAGSMLSGLKDEGTIECQPASLKTKTKVYQTYFLNSHGDTITDDRIVTGAYNCYISGTFFSESNETHNCMAQDRGGGTFRLLADSIDHSDANVAHCQYVCSFLQ